MSLRPVPTGRAFAWLAAGLLPAALTPWHPGFAWGALGLDLAVLLLCAWDARRAPGPKAVRVSRTVSPRLAPGRPEPVRLRLENLSGSALRGELRDAPPDTALADAERHQQSFACPADSAVNFEWTLTPLLRGPLSLTAVHVRLEGPLGLCAVQFAVPLPEPLKAWPDAGEAARDALALAVAARALCTVARSALLNAARAPPMPAATTAPAIRASSSK